MEQTGLLTLKHFNELANTAAITDITFSHIIGTGRFTNK